MHIFLILSLVGSSLLLVLSIYPGVLNDLALLGFWTSCLWLPVLVFFGVYLLLGLVAETRGIKAAKPDDSPPEEFAGVAEPLALRRRRMTIAWAVVAMNLTLVAFNVPERVALAASWPFFHASLAGRNPADAVKKGWFGVYYVDEVEEDPQGGVYFRTHSGPSVGIGPDGVSYGFAHRPNPAARPFGSVSSQWTHLFGRWYSFAASE